MPPEPLESSGGNAFIDACMPHAAPLCRYARVCVGTVEEAEDLTQEVLLQAYESRMEFTGGNLRAWLYQIARNRISKFKRRQAIERRGHNAVRVRYSERSDVQSDRIEMQEALLSALSELSPLEQEVVRLKFARFENEDIVKLLNLSRNHLNVVFFRAIQKLRAAVGRNDTGQKEMSVPR